MFHCARPAGPDTSPSRDSHLTIGVLPLQALWLPPLHGLQGLELMLTQQALSPLGPLTIPGPSLLHEDLPQLPESEKDGETLGHLEHDALQTCTVHAELITIQACALDPRSPGPIPKEETPRLFF